MVPMHTMDRQAFESACEKIVAKERERNGIGTLSEKTVHAVIKNYMEPDETKHEIKVGSFVADILNDEGIIEIQTAHFNVMRRKLDAFLPEHKVTIVYPVPAVKYLSWIDVDTGEVTGRRKSPKRGSAYEVFRELYKIKSYLSNPNLRILVLLIDLEESRLLNGWSQDKKKGSVRYDRIPTGLVDEVLIERVEDYRMLVPVELGDSFTTRTYAKATKLPLAQAQTALHIMNYLNVVMRTGKEGRAYLYSMTDE